MIKYKSVLTIFTLFFCVSFANAEWKAVNCKTEAKQYMENVFKNDSFEISSGMFQNNCAFKISSKLRDGDSVNYGFFPGGRLTISTNFASQVQTNKYSRQVSSKSYYFDSAVPSNVQLFHDSKTGNLKVITNTGKEFIFNSETKNIDEEQTKDFQVSQKPLTPYTDIIQIKPKEGFMSTFKVRFGNSNTIYPNVDTLLETKNKSCKVKSHKINLFKYKCREGNCSCVREEEPYCLISYAEMQRLNLNTYNDIDGSAPIYLDKNKQKKLISSYCPNFFDSQEQLKKNKDTQKPVREMIKKPLDRPHEKTAKKPSQKPIKVNEIAPRKIEIPVEKTVEKIVLKPKQKRTQKIVKKINKKPTQTKSPKRSLNVTHALTGEVINHCQNLLQKYFNSDDNQSLVNQYIKDQSKITLHRIAWNILKLNDKPTVDFDKTIKELLIKRDPKLHKQFINKSYPTRNTLLLESLAELKGEVSQKTSAADIPYTLKYSDTKMLHLLLEAEKVHGRSASSGVMDFVSIIRKSLNGRDKNKNIDYSQKVIDNILISKNTFETNLNSYLKENDCDLSKAFSGCNKSKQGEIPISDFLSSNKKVIDKVYQEQFERTKELKENFKWNTYWLHVK